MGPGNRAARARTLFASAAALAALGAALAGTSAAERPGRRPAPGPVQGPGVAGEVRIGPLTPVCEPRKPCDGPFADASVSILDPLDGEALVGAAVTNARGRFVVSVPPGDYVVRVEVGDARLPSCPDAPVHVDERGFARVVVDCDSGIR